LVAVGEVLREHTRPTDLIARFGGDEFAILLPGADLPHAVATAERLRSQVEKLAPSELVMPVTISVGVSSRTDKDNLASLLHRADAAMYDAKAKGRNCVVASERSDEHVVD